MQIEDEKRFTFNIGPGKYNHIVLTQKDPLDFYIFNINVARIRNVSDDIQVIVTDEPNFIKWQVSTQAVKAGANVNSLPGYQSEIFTKHCWGTIIFQPRNSGNNYLVLDNTHSSITPKRVDVDISLLTFESPTRRIIRKTTSKYGLSDFQKLYEESEAYFLTAKYSAACGSSRIALFILWKYVCETLSKKNIKFEDGKTPDIGILKTSLEPYAPTYMVGQLSQAWSIASELYHIEKHGGKEPIVSEAQLALNSTYLSMAYLCSLLSKT